MVDYSRFDHIGSDSDEETSAPRVEPSPSRGGHPDSAPKLVGSQSGSFGERKERRSGGDDDSSGAASFAEPRMMQASKKGKEGRIKFEYQGRTVYEWEQSLEEINLYIQPPPGLQANQVECVITPKHLCLGIKGNPPFIDEDTGGAVVVEESYWMMGKHLLDGLKRGFMKGGELNVNLQKMKKAETWPGALKGQSSSVDPVTLESMQKQIMLERFQNENPGFDFSGAEFNGQVPDARTFMGGVKYT